MAFSKIALLIAAAIALSSLPVLGQGSGGGGGGAGGAALVVLRPAVVPGVLARAAQRARPAGRQRAQPAQSDRPMPVLRAPALPL